MNRFRLLGRGVIRLGRDMALRVGVVVLLGLSLAGCQTGGPGGSATGSRSAFDSPASASFDSPRDSGRSLEGGARPCRFG
jgi:hypothetical protein